MSEERLRWRSAALSDVGRVRALNEDAYLELAHRGLWVVADGMGGHAAGDLASQLIVDALAKLEADGHLSTLIDAVEESILGVNDRLFKLSSALNETIGSTVLALVAAGRHCAFLWAGDSRLYRLRRGQLEQLTTDHSQVELYIEQGLLTRERAAYHASGNLITRAVGVAPDLFLDMDIAELAAGDRFLLCSDGLDRHVPPAEIATLLATGAPELAARRLVDQTLARGATDNVTVIVVETERAA